jgi:hypothetical protein
MLTDERELLKKNVDFECYNFSFILVNLNEKKKKIHRIFQCTFVSDVRLYEFRIVFALVDFSKDFFWFFPFHGNTHRSAGADDFLCFMF